MEQEFRDLILQNINNPHELEKTYRKDKSVFHRVFNTMYAEIKDNSNAQIWNERLNYQQDGLSLGQRNEFILVALTAFAAGLIAKIPDVITINKELFFQRNIGFIVFPALMFYFSWKQKLPLKKLLYPIVIVLLSASFINLLPVNDKSDSLTLAYIHLPIFLWSILGYIFVGGNLNSSEYKIKYLRFNGDFVVLTAIIVLSGAVFSGITIEIFKMIGLNIEKFYGQYIAIFGASAIPLVSTYLIQNNPQLVNKISPVVARIFTPIVFLTLLIFLIALFVSGQNIYTDRNFLLRFNTLLIGVMAIILFSLSEETKQSNFTLNLFFLFGLSLVAIIANGIALSAIAFRLAEFGITPNRMAVLGANILIFVHLAMVSYKLLQSIRGKAEVWNVESTIGFFMPIYGIWAALVTFLFPILFK